MIKKFLNWILDLTISYFFIYWLLFYSGLFYYNEPEKWGITVIILSLVSGVFVTLLGFFVVGLAEMAMMQDPGSGPYLIATYYLTSAISLIGITLLGSHYFNFEIMFSLSLLFVCLFIIFPVLVYIFFSRAVEHLSK